MADSLILLDLDMSAVERIVANLDNAEDTFRKYASDLASQTHAKVQELASQNLHGRREQYLAALSFEAVDEQTWVVSLDASAVWIEDGLPEDFQMLQRLLAGAKAKTAKDGSKYVVVPFRHGPGNGRNLGSESGKTNDDLKLSIQNELKRRKVPFAKIERDINTGEPKLGKLHDIFIHPKDHPLKTHEGVGQGDGALGDARQGPTGHRFLDRIQVVQRMGKNQRGQPQVKRGIMTFRTASSKQDASSRWVHPGLPPAHFFEQAYDWAKKEWDEQMVPKIVADLQRG